MKKEKIKKIIGLLVVPFFVMFGLTGCGDKKSSVADHKGTVPASASSKTNTESNSKDKTQSALKTSDNKTNTNDSSTADTTASNFQKSSDAQSNSDNNSVDTADSSASTTGSSISGDSSAVNKTDSPANSRASGTVADNSTGNKKNNINIGSYSSYDNKLKAFYFKRNGVNQPTDTEADFKAMFKKYNGYFQGDTSKKEIYLTFDEGYENGFTGKILDVLKQNNVKAAFFVTGDYIKREGTLVKRMVEEGHIVGNHTVHHYSMPSVSADKNKEEISGLTDMFTNLTGSDMIYFRPPKGEFSERTLKLTSDMGYKTIFWSYAYDDWDTKKSYSVDYVYDKFMKNLHNGEVALLHAVSQSNANALDKIIKGVKAKGYVFKNLDELAK